jgi:hypothetical protein
VVRLLARRPTGDTPTRRAQSEDPWGNASLPNQLANPGTPATSFGVAFASREVAIDGGGSAGDGVSTGRSHREELAASRNDASGHGETLLEGGVERLAESLSIGSGEAKGSGEGVTGRSVHGVCGGGIIRSHKGEELGHETKRVVGAGENAGEKMLEGVG